MVQKASGGGPTKSLKVEAVNAPDQPGPQSKGFGPSQIALWRTNFTLQLVSCALVGGGNAIDTVTSRGLGASQSLRPKGGNHLNLIAGPASLIGDPGGGPSGVGLLPSS